MIQAACSKSTFHLNLIIESCYMTAKLALSVHYCREWITWPENQVSPWSQRAIESNNNPHFNLNNNAWMNVLNTAYGSSTKDDALFLYPSRDELFDIVFFFFVEFWLVLNQLEVNLLQTWIDHRKLQKKRLKLAGFSPSPNRLLFYWVIWLQ